MIATYRKPYGAPQEPTHQTDSMNTRRTTAAILAVVAVVLMFTAPVIPAKLATYSTTGLPAGPPHQWFVSDPGGQHSGYTFDNGTNEVNVSTYDRMVQDPYSSPCPNSGVKFEGSVVLFTCNPTFTSSLPPPEGFESLAYWLVGHGGLYSDGRYLWK